jgi:hypothetical protein
LLPPPPQVLASYLDRFPTNPLCKQLANSWVEGEENFPNEGKQTYIRHVEMVSDDIPWIVRKVSGLSSLDFHASVTVDHRNRTINMTTKNISLRKKVVLDEECHYGQDPENPDHTYFEQTATLSLPGVPSSMATKCEEFLIGEYEKGIGEGRKVDQELIDRKLRAGFKAPPTWKEANPALEAALQRKERSSSMGSGGGGGGGSGGMKRSASQESLRSVSSQNSRARATLYGREEQRVSQSEAQQYLLRKFGLDIERDYFAELWKEEGLELDDTIDRARLLVMFSEEMGLGELAGADAAEIAMQEAEHVKLRKSQPGGQSPDPRMGEVPAVAARLLALVKELHGGVDAMFSRMDADGSGIVDSEKLAAALVSLGEPQQQQPAGGAAGGFSAADLDELIELVSMSDEDSFGQADWEEFCSSGAAGSGHHREGGAQADDSLYDDDGDGFASPARGQTPSGGHSAAAGTPQRGGSGGLEVSTESPAPPAPSPPSMGRLLLQDADTVMNWAVVSGWVSKQGRSRTGFKRRWCILVKHGTGHMSLVRNAGTHTLLHLPHS